MKKLAIIILILFYLGCIKATECLDQIVMKSGRNIPCTISKIGFYISYTDENKTYLMESTDNIQEIYLAELGKIYESELGFTVNVKKIRDFMSERNMKLRKTGFIIASGVRIEDTKIQDHTASSAGPLYIAFGLEFPLKSLPLSLEVQLEGGMSGEMINSYSEVYSYGSVGLNAKWYILPRYKKITIFAAAGLKTLSAEIDDNADGDPDEFYNTNFNEGTLKKSATGTGPSLDFGIGYNIHASWKISGVFHMSFINLDFSEFEANALKPGVGLRLTYFQVKK